MGRHHDDKRRIKVIAASVGAVAVAITAATFTASYAATADRMTPEKATQATETLREKASVTGTAWAVDPDTNEVLVTADSTVTGARWDTLKSTVDKMGRGVRLERAAGEFRLFAEGGDAIFAGGSRCSLGFNVVTNDNRRAMLTAGHCTGAGRQFSLAAGGQPAATVVRSTFPGNGDFALLTYNNRNVNAPSVVDIGRGQTVQIRRAAEARVGRQVERMGSTTGLRSGRVTGLNATVNYPEGRVTGLIQTTVCAEGGDSGGPLFTRNGDAIGLTSGGSGNCRTGGVTFFQPVTKALAAVGARIP